MNIVECRVCGDFYRFKDAFYGAAGWMSKCPKCGIARSIGDIEEYLPQIGALVSIIGGKGERYRIYRYDTKGAATYGEIIVRLIPEEEYTSHPLPESKMVRIGEIQLIPDWRLTTRCYKYGNGEVSRICHYEKNRDDSMVPCYNCADRSKCNRNIIDRLAQYEDIGLKPAELKPIVEDRELIVEVCPHCGHEIEMRWDVEKMGYKAFCPVCGGRLMICSQCMGGGDCSTCDYDSKTDTCKHNKEGKVFSDGKGGETDNQEL